MRLTPAELHAAADELRHLAAAVERSAAHHDRLRSGLESAGTQLASAWTSQLSGPAVTQLVAAPVDRCAAVAPALRSAAGELRRAGYLAQELAEELARLRRRSEQVGAELGRALSTTDPDPHLVSSLRAQLADIDRAEQQVAARWQVDGRTTSRSVQDAADTIETSSRQVEQDGERAELLVAVIGSVAGLVGSWATSVAEWFRRAGRGATAARGSDVSLLVASLGDAPLTADGYQDAAIDSLRARLPGWEDASMRTRNQAITAAYADLYLHDPATYKWAGMAAFASDLVGDGMGQALAGRQAGLPVVPGLFDFSFTELALSLETGNGLVYVDIYWQHLAYEHGGIETMRSFAADEQLSPRLLDAWEEIDAGRRTGDEDRVWAGNAELLAYEQEITLQQGVYDRDRSMYRQLSSSYVGIAQPMSSPLPGDGVTFQQHVPGGDLGDFDDRWRWIEESMLPAWREREAELRPAIAELSR